MTGAHGVVSRYESQIGVKIGDLTFVGLSPNRGDRGRVIGTFLCVCGRQAEFPAGRVLNGNYRTHCGCKTDKGAHRTHGMRSTGAYSSWQAMKSRCLVQTNKDYPKWGGSGVTIHPEWVDSFEAFFDHIGPRPPGTSLDRIDGRLGYQPGNVRWATRSEQQRNRKSAFRWFIKGLEFETYTEAAAHFGVSKHTIWRWVNGQMDRRRNTFTQPRGDCYVEPRY